MKRLQGKVALVTGGSRGIGRAVARRLASDGALVAVHYAARQGAAEEVVRDIQYDGGAAFAIGADFKPPGGTRELYAALDAALLDRTGDVRFDILVNNAGIGQASTIGDLTEQAFDEVVDVNLKAPLFVIQQALPRLRDGGRIINLSSLVTQAAYPNLLGYSIAKGAVNTLTLALAKQLGERNITVNAIMPGIVDTEMNAPMKQDPAAERFAAGLSVFGRWGQPEDIADTAAFLASPDSCWITGQLINASGGSHL
ncbi:SDR family oxidoreductase [Paenibacillus arenilitoris]|uniref:SDR family oxidoreductase n=1 Tax=Paenibacillus arenilitoris TaxID=2772299 RepID=A0A927H482_9BACL|nr:SDR family oxidoreductase [Paenibacillus arenilitoris]MBD2867635.1 SDR family oxidoreductase [Paenibacillus arenilitoris]